MRLRRLVSQDEVLPLVCKKHKGLGKLLIYSLCGLSLRYFDRAYKRGDAIRKFGSRLGRSLSWQDLLDDYVSGKMRTTMSRTSRTSSGNLGKLDAKLDREVRKCEVRMRQYEDFLFGIQLFCEQTKLVQPPSVLRITNFEEYYEKVKRRGERAIRKAKKILTEVKTSGNLDRLKEVEIPPLEKDIMRTAYPDKVPRMTLLVETYNELFPRRDRKIPLTNDEHRLIMDRVMDKF